MNAYEEVPHDDSDDTDDSDTIVASMGDQLKRELADIQSMSLEYDGIIGTSTDKDAVKEAKANKKALEARKKEIYREMEQYNKIQMQITEMGGTPDNVEEYISYFLERYGIVVRSGDLVSTNHPVIKSYQKLTIALLHTKNKLNLKFSDTSIKIALQWYDNICTEAYIDSLKQNIMFDASAAATVDEKLLELENLFFEVSKPGLMVAVIKRFIWQVKCKALLEQDPSDKCRPIMPLIYGAAQSTGKTKLVERICGPLKDLTLQTTFSKMCHESALGNWDKYIAHFPEMAKADKESTEIIKNAITQYRIPFRILFGMETVVVNNRCTFIGDANKPLDYFIKDTTGLSRFVQLNVRPELRRFTPEVRAIHAHINSIDWTNVWRSVDENGDDPLVDYLELVTHEQDELRVESIIEQWLDDEDRDEHRDGGDDHDTRWGVSKNGKVKAKEYKEIFAQNFVPWCKQNFPKGSPGNHAEFLKELKSMAAEGLVEMVKTDNKYHFRPKVHTL